LASAAAGAAVQFVYVFECQPARPGRCRSCRGRRPAG